MSESIKTCPKCKYNLVANSEKCWNCGYVFSQTVSEKATINKKKINGESHQNSTQITEMNDGYPEASEKPSEVVLLLQQQEKHLKRISDILTFFFVLFIINLISSVILIIIIASNF